MADSQYHSASAYNDNSEAPMGFWQDVIFAVRMMAKSPWFTFVAALTLALGIGINAGGFSIANAVLWKKLPFTNPNEIVSVAMWDGVQSADEAAVSYPEFVDIRSRARSFKSVAALQSFPAVLSGDGVPAERYSGAFITANLFSFVGLHPYRGRDLEDADQNPGAPRVVLISHDIWQKRFAAAEDVLGKTIRVNGLPAAIVGVMPPGIRFPFAERVWMPFTERAAPGSRSDRYVSFFGRLAAGVSLESCRAELAGLGEQFAREDPATTTGYRLTVLTFLEWANGGPDGRTGVAAIFGAVGFVLLIACANVANLLLSHAMRRSKEVSIRSALGASRWRVVRQFLVESVMLGAIGGVFGLAVAEGFIVWMSSMVASEEEIADMPYWITFTMDYHVFAYFFVICIGTGIAFGCVPALQMSRTNVNDNLKEGGRGTVGSFRARRMTTLLLIGELAMTVVLLTGAGLVIRSFLHVNSFDLHVDKENLVSFPLQLPPVKYPGPEAKNAFVDRLIEVLNRPGRAATVAAAAPLEGAWSAALALRDQDLAKPDGKLPTVAVLPVAERYFSTVGATMLRGRVLQESDGQAGSEGVVVNDRFARSYWPDQNPLGKYLRLDSGPWLAVVGVSPDIYQTGDWRGSHPDALVYVPYRLNPWSNIRILMRSPEGADVAAPVRAELSALDPDLAIDRVRTVESILDASLWPQRVFGVLFSVLSAMAILLSSVGLYGVTAHGVSQRTQEIGVRIALGATFRRVLWLILRHSLQRIAAGIVVGLIGAAFLTDIIAFALLVPQTDPVTFVSVAVFLTAVSLLAALIPAWRAASLNPVVALRSE